MPESPKSKLSITRKTKYLKGMVKLILKLFMVQLWPRTLHDQFAHLIGLDMFL